MSQTKKKCINFVVLLSLQLYELNLDFVFLQTFNLEKFRNIDRVGFKLGRQVGILQLKVNSFSWLASVLFMFGLQNMAINTFHFVNEHYHCRNPSFGLATKAKGLQGCGPSGSSGVKAKKLQGCGPRKSMGITSQTPGNVKKCEGV